MTKKDPSKEKTGGKSPSVADAENAEVARLAAGMRRNFPCIAPTDAMAKALEMRAGKGKSKSEDPERGGSGNRGL